MQNTGAVESTCQEGSADTCRAQEAQSSWLWKTEISYFQEETGWGA
jgi:hypothetical protein